MIYHLSLHTAGIIAGAFLVLVGVLGLSETGLRASREAFSALSRCRNCAAHHLPGLDLLVGRHHPNG